MKRSIALLVLLMSTAVLGQEDKKAEEYNSVREYRNRVFEVHNRDPREIASAVRLLGSGFKGSGLSVNQEMRTITVRDFPENVAAIEEAIKRLDQPAAQTPDIELKISVLIGSKGPFKDAPAIPDDLAPVVKQLQSTLRYSNYALMTATVQRTKPGHGLEGSGVAEPTLLGMTVQENRPIMYSYRLTGIAIGPASERPSIEVENFNFSMRIPINVGGGIQYQPVGFETPVSIRQNEKVVIGTTTMGEKALIVVVTANVGR